MTCLDEKIKRKLKLKNFKMIFQISKIVEFEIHSKNKEIKISLHSQRLSRVCPWWRSSRVNLDWRL